MCLDFTHARGPTGNRPSTAHRDRYGPVRESPGSLADKELHLWVTYPVVKPARRKGNRTKSRHAALKLWAVVIIEGLRQTGAFTYEVTLRRIFKRDERTVKLEVSNDPGDQSDEAYVFGYVSPTATLLTPLEQHLSQVVAKRVYDAIAQTWPREATHSPKSGVIRPALRLCPESVKETATALPCGPPALVEQRSL